MNVKNQKFQEPVVLRTIVTGTVVFTVVIILLLAVSYAGLHNTYVLLRLGFALLLFLYAIASWLLLRAGRVKLTAFLMITLYGCIAAITAILWSITAPFSLLMFAFLISMAGVTLGSRYALAASIFSVCTLAAVQTLTAMGVLVPNRSSIMLAPSFGDVAGFGSVFFVIGMISWLSGRQTEQSLQKALEAEAALQREKNMLSKRLDERTRKLRSAQLQEMQQLYRFAELGQLSTALLHDLANHLTVLTLNIEDIDQNQHSSALKRAKKSIEYLDKMVDQVRTQLQGTSQNTRFSVPDTISQTRKILSDKLRASNVKVEIITGRYAQKLVCQGDPVRFQQIITILISNAIDAYKNSSSKMTERKVLIEAKVVNRSIVVSIQDKGIGIAPEVRHKLFKPFYSTKEEGMGIGLFIAKQMLETHFKGDISITDSNEYTEFVIKIPRVYAYGSKKR